MKNNNKLSQDELRQKVDGFSMEYTQRKASADSYKIVDQPIYLSHSANYEDIKKHTK